MARRKQPASDWSPMKTSKPPEVPAPKPRPVQRQNGGRKPDPNRGIPVMCRLPPELKAMVDASCEYSDIDRSAFIRTAIIYWFTVNPPQKKG